MNSIKSRIDCPMRHENGNCEPMHNAYYMGKSDALCKKEDLLQLLAMERQQYYDELQKAKAIIGELRHLYEQAKAEAAEVKHGEWIGEKGGYECSVCKGEAPDENYWPSLFCPSCGAKMDAKREGTKE